MHKILLIVAASVFLISCSSDKRPIFPEHRHPGDPFTGSLTDLLDYMYDPKTGAYLRKTCDIDLAKDKYRVAKFLEINRSKIENHTASSKIRPECKLVKDVDELKVYDCSPDDHEVNDEWVTVKVASWPEIIEIYKETDKFSLDKDWIYLNSMVRGLIMSEYARTVIRRNFSLHPEDIPKLKDLEAIVSNCSLDDTCTEIKSHLTTEQIKWMKSKEYYWYHYDNAVSNSSTSDTPFKDRLSHLQWRIERDLHSRSPQKNSGVFVNKEGEILVSAHAPSLNNPEALNSFFDEAWSLNGLKVRTHWNTKSTLEQLSLNIFGFGGRAFVRYFEDRTEMNLSRIERYGVLTHEFGHVLGLRDEYYELFDSESCEYSYVYNPIDIMSNSSSGKILPKHIEAIKGLHLSH